MHCSYIADWCEIAAVVCLEFVYNRHSLWTLLGMVWWLKSSSRATDWSLISSHVQVSWVLAPDPGELKCGRVPGGMILAGHRSSVLVDP